MRSPRRRVRRGPSPEDPPLGAPVRVRADDHAQDPISGELVMIDDDEIALRRTDPQVGEVVVHFPRVGYELRGRLIGGGRVIAAAIATANPDRPALRRCARPARARA